MRQFVDKLAIFIKLFKLPIIQRLAVHCLRIGDVSIAEVGKIPRVNIFKLDALWVNARVVHALRAFMGSIGALKRDGRIALAIIQGASIGRDDVPGFVTDLGDGVSGLHREDE